MPREDEELTRVGPGTPGGEYLRRFWQPILLSQELQDLPRRIRILGEDLVAFRDKSGAAGLLEPYCAHRGVSLEYGLIAAKGIRCCYHGWCFDVDGTILETPGEPPDSTLKERLYQGAYPLHEYGGIVFAYLGPPELKPDFPILDTFDLPGYQLVAQPGYVWPCNWVQVKENSMDPAHLAFLHTLPGSEGFTEDLGDLGVWDYVETSSGMVYVDTRRQGDQVWVRVADFIPPNIHQFPPNADPMAKRTRISRPTATRWAVPIDDHHTMQIGFRHIPEGQPVILGAGFGQDGDRPYEERQRVPGDYDAQVSIHGGVARHGRERLATTDRGVIMLRNMIRRGIRAVQQNETPWCPGSPNGQTITTYSQDRVVSGIPPTSSPEEDRGTLLKTGRQVIEDCERRAQQCNLWDQ
jgi:phenylpropionate dioxygenase-like ring-hydroxylating dioxygenase large terminal subunit